MADPDRPGLSRRQSRIVLGICCSSLLLVSMDNTIVNVALPSIKQSLGASLAGLQWVVDAYLLTLASVLMLSGSTADRLGRRRIFQTGLVVFMLGSLACSVAPDLAWLIGARVLQAVGGSMLNPVAVSIITNVFTDRRERARAIGIWGSMFGLSLALGPIIGGLLTQTVGWRSVFWVNLPFGLVALVMTRHFVPESRAARARAIDPVGQILVALGLGSLVYAIIEAPGHGWSSPVIIALFCVAVGSTVTLLIYEPRRHEPLLELGLFRSAPFSGATLIAVLAFIAYGMFLFLTTLYLQDVRHYSPLRAGLCILPLALATLVAAPISGRMIGALGPRPSLVIAGVCTTASTALLLGLTATTPLPLLLTAYLVFGVGAGMVNSPITITAVSGMPRDQAGVAAAIVTTSRQVGSSLGVALGGSIVGVSVGTAGPGFTHATHPAWWLISVVGVVIIVLALASTSRWGLRTAPRFDDPTCEE